METRETCVVRELVKKQRQVDDGIQDPLEERSRGVKQGVRVEKHNMLNPFEENHPRSQIR